MNWIFFASIVILGATGIHFFSKLAKDGIDPLYGLSLTMLAGFLVSLTLLPFAKTPMTQIEWSDKSILYYGLIGLCITVAHFGIFYMFKAGAPISLATPLVRFMPAILAVAIGVFIFQEVLKPAHIAGLIFAFLAVFLITKG